MPAVTGDARGLRGAWEWALRGRRRTRRPATALIAWPLATAAVLLAILRVAGLEQGLRLVQLTAFVPYLTVACAVATIAVVLTRRPVASAVASVAVIALAACLLPRALGSPAPDSGTPLVVMAMNMRLGGADAESIVDLVREAGVDVLAVQEITPRAEAALLAAGLGETMPFQEIHLELGAAGSAIFSRLPFSDSGMRKASEPGFNQAYATVTLGNGTSVTVESVHPVAPIEQVDRWLTGLRNQIPGDAPGPPRILAGDFNATLDHRALRDLLATGYRDAADAVGAGFTPTWPFYGRRSAVTPRIAIDHILVPDGIGVRDFRAVTVARTDHRAIIATLTVG